MISRILRRVKVLLGLTDNSRDTVLMYLIEDAVSQIELYIHAPINENLIPIAAKLTVNLYLQAGYNQSSVDSEGSGSITPVVGGVGELKSEAYENVKFEYTTTADMLKASNSSSSSSTAEAGIGDAGYFDQQIKPLLNGYRKLRVIK